ncbi:hypothetical protein G9272_26115 [Streptomyces asoensis]|uniref:Integral-membrane protein n=1 Tax=Streptomyces asoensis TaxID=249586 RepID=A0A6M4WT52_9ACTN|nr:hypothetical protein [Streptomyces asoensis]QJT03328.1 hypothetical protein G9272_26115 [Streptomyces asoensis]
MTAGWCTRTLRAALFAAVCVLLAALGHVMMSGSEVPAWALAAGVAVTGIAGWCLAGRERGLALIVTVVVAAQTALHSAFSLAGPESGDAASAGMGVMGMGSMRMDSMDMDMGHMAHVSHLDHASHTGHMGHMSHMSHVGEAAGEGGSSSFGMLAAHLLAALLCGLWLAHGEKAAFRILRAVAGRLAAPLRLLLALPVTPDRPRVRFRRRGSARAPRLLLLTHAITTRGPPSGTAAAV